MCNTLEPVCCCKPNVLPPGYRLLQGEGGKGWAFAYGNAFPHSGFDTCEAATRGAIHHYCAAVGICAPILQDAILFRVARGPSGARLSGVRGSFGWDKLGFTNDLSLAMRYKDADPRGVWLAVSRGFIDQNGRYYSIERQPLPSLPVHGYYR